MTATFRLDVDPDLVAAAAEQSRRAAEELTAQGIVLVGSPGAFAAGWEGDAANAAISEVGNLAGLVSAAPASLSGAADSLEQLGTHYRIAQDATVPSLNRRWDAADVIFSDSLSSASWAHGAALGQVPPDASAADRTASADAAERRRVAAVDDAAAERDATRGALQREYDALVEELRARTRAAGDALGATAPVAVPEASVVTYGLSLGGWLGGLLPSEFDASAALAGSLPLGTLESRLAQPPNDLAQLAALLDEARAALLPPTTYADTLALYWQAQAFLRAGIDPASWRPEDGADANRATIEAVYAYYARLYLDNGELEWAGMAAMIGPSFAAGFLDLAMLRDLATRFQDLPAAVRQRLPGLQELGSLSAAEIRFYETTLLQMQRNIFEDQGMQHEAYLRGGPAAIAELRAAGLIDGPTARAWADIDRGNRTGDADLVRAGNTHMLRREQYEIIAGDYDRMREHSPTGAAITFGMTFTGAPSIPGARSYPDVFPLQVALETPGPRSVGTPHSVFGFGVPHLGADNPLQGTIRVDTPLPDGNVSVADQRWQLIEQDTLPAYQRLLDTNPGEARRILETPVGERIDDYRLTERYDEILGQLLDWDVVDMDQ